MTVFYKLYIIVQRNMKMDSKRKRGDVLSSRILCPYSQKQEFKLTKIGLNRNRPRHPQFKKKIIIKIRFLKFPR